MLQYLRSISEHAQLAPEFVNPALDPALKQLIPLFCPLSELQLDQLHKFGQKLVDVYQPQAQQAQRTPPQLVQFDAFGKRIDRIVTSEGWKTQHRLAAQDGIIALAYQKGEFGKMQRWMQLVRLMMYQAYSGLYGCPLAMTDGAAFTLTKIIEQAKISQKLKIKVSKYLQHLLSRDPSHFWTSGQWMTQKKGGSDVSQTQTIAIPGKNQSYKLYGYKWFSSAVQADISLALAKILPEGLTPTQENVKKLPLSLFLVKLRNKKGQLRNIKVVRLKDKLGTHQLPTAQLILEGAKAYLISQPGKGVRSIASMLNITRVYNACTAVSLMRKITLCAIDYSQKRFIGKTKLADIPVHQATLRKMDLTGRGSMAFCLKVAELLSMEQAKTASKSQKLLLRIFTPLLKLFTAKEGISVISQGLQSFGGLGYIESSNLPVMLRDAQVLSIWQGTTNVLAADFIRAISIKGSLQAVNQFFSNINNLFYSSTLIQPAGTLLATFKRLVFSSNLLIGLIDKPSLIRESELRVLAMGSAQLLSGYVLLQLYLKSSKQRMRREAEEFVQERRLLQALQETKL